MDDNAAVGQESNTGRDIAARALAVWRFVVYLYRQFVEDDCQNTAAALTFQTLFAIVPALTVTFSILSLFEAFGGVGRSLENFLFENVLPENVAVVQEYLHSFSSQARSLSGPSLVFLAVTAFLMLYTIEGTFNEIWNLKEPRQGFQRFMMYWAVLTAGPILLGAGIAITTYVMSLPLISDVTESPLVLHLLPLFLSAATFTFIYTAVPNTKVQWRHALVGGASVALVFESAKFLFSFIMSRSSYELIYGTFAVVPLFLFWIYVSWTIVLVGAVLVKVMGVYRFSGWHRVEAPLYQILLILEIFHAAHLRGEVVTEDDIRQLHQRIEMEKWTDFQQKLIEVHLIRLVDGGGMVLTRDLSTLTLWQLHRLLPWPLPEAELMGDDPWEKTLSECMRTANAGSQEQLSFSLDALFRGDKR